MKMFGQEKEKVRVTFIRFLENIEINVFTNKFKKKNHFNTFEIKMSFAFEKHNQAKQKRLNNILSKFFKNKIPNNQKKNQIDLSDGFQIN